MFDITQVRSGLNKKDLKEDIVYINEVLDEVIYIDELETEYIEEVPSYLDEIDRLKDISHKHENMAVLNKITNEMVDYWDSASVVPTKISELENDSDFITKDYVDDRVKDYFSNITLISPNGTEFLLKIDTDGVLNPVKIK